MKTKTSKLLAVILAVTMLFAVIPLGTFTASAVESTGNTTFDAFINDSRWAHGVSWNGYQTPKLNSAAQFYGCAAYCYDFTAYCFGTYNPRGGSVFYSTSEIRAGDILTVGNQSDGSGHWFVCLKRSGDSLYVAEGNYSSSVRIGWNYTISGGKFAQDSRSFTAGYHFLDHTHSYGAWQTVTAATCTTAGSRKRVCSCGDTQTETVAATGHSWNSGVITTQPGCKTKGVKTYTCSKCKGTKTEEISELGHNYEAVNMPATCTEAAYTKYICSRCGSTYNEEIQGWSEWSTTVPPANAANSEQKTQYRYRTKETSTGTTATKSGWITVEGSEKWVQKSSGTHIYFPRPYGFNGSAYTNYSTGALSASTTATTKREVSSSSHYSYIYWHWAYNCTYGGNTYISDHYGDRTDYQQYDGVANIWEAFESSTDVREHTYSDGCVQVTGRSGHSDNWFINEAYKQTYTDYEKQYTYYRWSDWSSWQDTAVAASADREIETRTVYRYNSNDNGPTGHNYGSAWKYDSQNHWQECTTCNQIGNMGTHIFSNDKDTTCNTCGYVRTVINPISETDFKISVESKKITAGKEFTVTVNIANNPGFSYLEISPEFSEQLILVSADNGNLISDFTKARQYIWAADADVTANGTLMTLTFTTAENTAPGNYIVDFIVRNCVDYSEQNVDIAVESGVIEIIDFIYGDVNGDQLVNGQDVVRLKKYLANYDYDIGASDVQVDAGADVNGDGAINGQDVVRLKKYLANYDYDTGTSSIALGPQS